MGLGPLAAHVGTKRAERPAESRTRQPPYSCGCICQLRGPRGARATTAIPRSQPLLAPAGQSASKPMAPHRVQAGCPTEGSAPISAGRRKTHMPRRHAPPRDGFTPPRCDLGTEARCFRRGAAAAVETSPSRRGESPAREVSGTSRAPRGQRTGENPTKMPWGRPLSGWCWLSRRPITPPAGASCREPRYPSRAQASAFSLCGFALPEPTLISQRHALRANQTRRTTRSAAALKGEITRQGSPLIPPSRRSSASFFSPKAAPTCSPPNQDAIATRRRVPETLGSVSGVAQNAEPPVVPRWCHGQAGLARCSSEGSSTPRRPRQASTGAVASPTAFFVPIDRNEARGRR